MEDKEIKLRLIEAAAQLPGVRAGIDATEQAERATSVVKMWYNLFEYNTVAPTQHNRAPQRRNRDKR